MKKIIERTLTHKELKENGMEQWINYFQEKLRKKYPMGISYNSESFIIAAHEEYTEIYKYRPVKIVVQENTVEYTYKSKYYYEYILFQNNTIKVRKNLTINN